MSYPHMSQGRRWNRKLVTEYMRKLWKQGFLFSEKRNDPPLYSSDGGITERTQGLLLETQVITKPSFAKALCFCDRAEEEEEEESTGKKETSCRLELCTCHWRILEMLMTDQREASELKK